MQSLARDGLTAEQVRALLTADGVEFSAGLDLLDASNRLVEDISDDLAGGSISYDNREPVNASCRLSVTRQLAWGRDRVRPWMTVSDGVVSARFNLGVYVLTTPDERRGEDPVTFEVEGYDLQSLLQTGPADTYVVADNTTYIQAARDVLTASGVGASLLVDGTRQDTVLPYAMVWAVSEDGPSWLRILTDLFAAIAYDVWVDADGRFRAAPFVDPVARPVEWTLDTSDPATNIVGEDRTLTVEAGEIANWWRFVRSDTDAQPSEGDGIYTVENLSDGVTSQAALGRVVRRFVRLDAADQETLVAQGDKIVAEDKAAVRTVKLSVDPLPVMWHRDVFRLIDGGVSEKFTAATWELNLDGSPGSLELGGPPARVDEPRDEQVSATVTSADPLRVVVDGATQDSPANSLDSAAYTVGQRVNATLRNPQRPLIQGEET